MSTNRLIVATIVVLMCIILVITVTVASRPVAVPRESFAHMDVPMVYCLMVTGKDDARVALARGSVQNFLDQTYASKRLIIVNHHPTQSVLRGKELDGVTEVLVDKAGKTLGDLRNMSMAYVQPGTLWTPWDDDDVRSPDYLELLFQRMITSGADVVLTTRRYEYNANTDFAWETRLPTGTWMFFAKYDPAYRYASLDTREDNAVKEQIKALKKAVDMYDNPPRMYIRLVHTNNTSVAVDPVKQTLGPDDTSIDTDVDRYIHRQVDAYFPQSLAVSSS
jgi:hypothetical protein